jgi:hypothetical protein
MKYLLMSLVVLLSVSLMAMDRIEVPPEVQQHVLEGYFPIFLEKGDLNGDNREDYIMVLQMEGENSVDKERPSLILIRASNGSLHLAKRNDKVVYCEGCGGMMGDPFQQIRITKNRFVVSHYGGSAWRWSVDCTFAYSRRDDTWQLVRVESVSFHASDPDSDTKETTVHEPPRDFGKIDIADFDPDNYLGQGPK